MPNVAPSSSGQLSFGEFFYGISQQESGGNYNAVNHSSGALGKYQIMPSNVPYWSQKYLGVTWSPQAFLQDPNKQEALARAVLQTYYQDYGPRGAAAAWYSGNPALQNNYSPQNGGPSVGTYVDQVLAHGTGHPNNPAGQVLPGPQAVGVPVTTTDKTVKAPAAPTVASSSGMGAVSAPGSLATQTPGADAVGSATSQMGAVGEQAAPVMNVAPPLPKVAPTTSGATSSTTRQLALNAAMKYLGIPYVFGGGSGSGPSTSALGKGVGFDCSGLVQAALNAAGITSNHFSYAQLAMGQKTPIAQLKPGDLVGMNGGDHIGLYAGNNQIVVADHTGTNVQLRSIGSNEGAYGVSLANLYK